MPPKPPEPGKRPADAEGSQLSGSSYWLAALPPFIATPKDRGLFHIVQRPSGADGGQLSGSSYWLAALPPFMTNPKDRGLFHIVQRPSGADGGQLSGSSYWLAALPPCGPRPKVLHGDSCRGRRKLDRAKPSADGRPQRSQDAPSWRFAIDMVRRIDPGGPATPRLCGQHEVAGGKLRPRQRLGACRWVPWRLHSRRAESEDMILGGQGSGVDASENRGADRKHFQPIQGDPSK
jgi:hypothetical protein